MSKKTKEQLVAEAHRKYVDAVEAARKEYIEAKKRIYPEYSRPSPEEQARTIKELQEKVKFLEKQLKEASK